MIEKTDAVAGGTRSSGRLSSQQPTQTEGNRALELFVNRHELTKRFAEYINTDPPPEKILVFHGDGGNGKSLLLKFLMSHFCKRFPEDTWQSQADARSDKLADFIRNVTDWEQDFQRVPAVVLDFGQQPVGDDRPQDPFYGLMMLYRYIAKAAKLYFPLFEYACALYLEKQGKLNNEYIVKLFPSQELFVIGGIVNIARTISDSKALAVGLAGGVPVLVASTLNAIAKHYGKDLALYFRGKGLESEDLEKMRQLDANALLMALPDFFAEDLNLAMQRGEAPERVVLFFDTHEAFWGDGRRQGEALFFEQDKWLRRLLSQLDLTAGIVVAVATREVPRWPEATQWRIPGEYLDTRLIAHLPQQDALDYLKRSGIEESELCNSLIEYARQESEQVHPLFLGLCADLVLAARDKNEALTREDFCNIPELDDKCQILMERLLKYVSEEVRDAVDALSACRAFNEEIFFTLGESLHFQATNASFRCLTRFSFIWEAEGRGDNWYRIHPLVRQFNLKKNLEITNRAHQILEGYYRKRGDEAEAIYHAICHNRQVGIQEWLRVFNTAKQGRPSELCRNLLEIRKELNF